MGVSWCAVYNCLFIHRGSLSDGGTDGGRRKLRLFQQDRDPWREYEECEIDGSDLEEKVGAEVFECWKLAECQDYSAVKALSPPCKVTLLILI